MRQDPRAGSRRINQLQRAAWNLRKVGRKGLLSLGGWSESRRACAVCVGPCSCAVLRQVWGLLPRAGALASSIGSGSAWRPVSCIDQLDRRASVVFGREGAML